MGRLPPWLVMWVCLAAAAGGHAQPTPPSSGNVLFLTPGALDEATTESLREALLAQFATSDAELELRPEGEAVGLSQRLAEARQLHAAEGTVAVFWIRVEAADQWLLHMLDPSDERVVVRRVDASPDQLAAAIEAVAVMVEQSTEALLQGQPLEPEPPPPSPPPPPPPPPPAPAPPPPEQGRLRIALAYSGSQLAPETGWQHGAAFVASWALRPWLHIGGRYIALGSVHSDAPVPFDVERHPLEVHASLRQAELPGLILDGELALGADLLIRHTPEAAGIRAEPDSVKWLFNLTPRFRIELPVTAWLAVHAGAGVDILLNSFKYIYDNVSPRSALEPSPIRLVAEAGLAVYP